MGERSLWNKFKCFLAGLFFRGFLWASNMSEETYWQLIYEQEKQYRK